MQASYPFLFLQKRQALPRALEVDTLSVVAGLRLEKAGSRGAVLSPWGVSEAMAGLGMEM